ncbi:hypothetical protein AYI68_g7310, partial [Smittium mucronatum]
MVRVSLLVLAIAGLGNATRIGYNVGMHGFNGMDAGGPELMAADPAAVASENSALDAMLASEDAAKAAAAGGGAAAAATPVAAAPQDGSASLLAPIPNGEVQPAPTPVLVGDVVSTEVLVAATTIVQTDNLTEVQVATSLDVGVDTVTAVTTAVAVVVATVDAPTSAA